MFQLAGPYLLLKRLVELRDSVTIVCEELDMDGLLNTEWAALKKIVNLLEPFASYTQLVSAGKTVTFSAIVPFIEELRLHLEKVTNFHIYANLLLALYLKIFYFSSLKKTRRSQEFVML